VLGLEANERNPSSAPAEQITTSVDISGAWEGTISLSFSRLLEQRLAAAMLECPESEATPALVQDVVSELANVIGGNVKGVLPGPCKLSLPRVDTEARTSSPDEQQQMWFDCAGQPFSVTVRSRPYDQARSA
jgi:chemotaxis protein CheX